MEKTKTPRPVTTGKVKKDAPPPKKKIFPVQTSIENAKKVLDQNTDLQEITFKRKDGFNKLGRVNMANQGKAIYMHKGYGVFPSNKKLQKNKRQTKKNGKETKTKKIF